MRIKRCSRCIVPSTYTGVKFDENGMCSVCEEWDKMWKGYNFRGRPEEFKKTFKKKKGKYDCIAPFSGGKDSSYVLYYLKRKLGLTPLAVNLNNYFQTDIIKENIELMTHKLGVDMISFSPDFSNWCELMRRCFERSTIPCLPCDVGIYSLAYRTALMTETKVVVFPGGKLAAPKRPGRAVIMYKTLEMVTRHFDKGRKKIDLSNFAVTPEMVNQVDVVYFGNYFDWREQEILNTVMEHLSWKKKGRQHARIDCIFEPILNYLYSKRAKISKQCSRLSAMVRDGQIDRAEALARDKAYMLRQIPKEFKEIMKRIGITRQHLQKQIEGRGLMKPLWYH